MASALERPNLYELACGKTQVSYSTTSITGQPQFTYTTSEGSRTFSGTEIETTVTRLGEEVTVVLESVPDAQTIALTVLIPGIRLGPGETVALRTLGVLTTTTTTIAGPPPGVSQTYDPMTLDGEASLVDF